MLSTTGIKSTLGALTSLKTVDKSSLVNAVNENVSGLANNTSQITSLTPQIVGIAIDNTKVVNSISTTLDETIIQQPYLGGYIEVQPDSWDGSNVAVDATTKTWGYPISLLPAERAKIKNDVFNGIGTNFMYIRFPLGFAYRGLRNIDSTTGLAMNIGQRFLGQNATLKSWFDSIVEAGGGLAPEYWCPPQYWVTSGSYSGNNQLRAGGTYAMTVTLQSIKITDPTQYNAQIIALANAMVNDLEYLHQNIAPVKMFGLQNEPDYGNSAYGECLYDAQTYNDVLAIVYPAILASAILSVYNDEPNVIKLLVASSDEVNPFTGIANTFITNHASMIWGYTHHLTRNVSGESYAGGAEWYKTPTYATIKGTKTNVIMNEYEYFTTTYGTDDFRCSNNMLHLINELVYGNAQILHPIIHICKPIGQVLASTNTAGYCLYKSNIIGSGILTTDDGNPEGLSEGCVTPNLTMYNSWALFGDNLPVGAYLVGSYATQIANAGWCAYKYSGKLYIFFANNGATDASIAIIFSASKLFNGKMYNMLSCGNKIASQTGSTITFVIPAYSGQVYIEDSVPPVIIVPFVTPPSGTVVVSDTFTRANSNLIGDAETGQVWTVNGQSTWVIANNQLAPTMGSNDGTVYVDTRMSDYTVSCDITFQNYASLAFRITDTNTHYRVRLSSAGFGLYKNAGGVATSLGSSAPSIEVGTTHNFKVVLLGASIKCYIDNVLLITASDSTNLTETLCGIYCPTTVCTDTYDNFKVIA
jgi:hypothetical protein